MVVSDKNKLLGTLTDGDIRRALLQGAGLKDKISKCRIKSKKIEKLYLNNLHTVNIFSEE